MFWHIQSVCHNPYSSAIYCTRCMKRGEPKPTTRKILYASLQLKRGKFTQKGHKNENNYAIFNALIDEQAIIYEQTAYIRKSIARKRR